MNKKVNSIIGVVILGLIFFVYRNWFGVHEIIGGDWPYFFPENVKEATLPPPLWAYWQRNGLGGANVLLGLQTFQSLLMVVFVQWLHIPWSLVYKIGWFGLFLILSFVSSVALWYRVFSRVSSTWPGLLAGLIYTTNTYVLMVTGGGQMGVALAYAVAPLVLASFIKLSNFKYIAIAGLILGFQLMIDPRITYVTLTAVGLYYTLKLKAAALMVTPVVVAVILNAFWLVPMVVMRNNPLESLGSAYTSMDSLKFFSFADFSHALSFLHPNWPENLFGKTYFLQPEFLVLPILAFSSLLLLKNPKSQILNPKQYQNSKFKIQNENLSIFFFVLLAIVGVFLAKGAQEPFGSVYQWMFMNVPGFVMFRDPTKWYVLIAISYSVLIPFTLKQLAELRIRGKTLLITLFILFWLFSIREAALGQLGGTFAKRNIPKEYVELANFIARQPEFFRTLWVPRQSRFAFTSSLHPAVEAEPLFGATNAAQFADVFFRPETPVFLEGLGISYVVIPYDVYGEIFQEDRAYDLMKRKHIEEVLDGVVWLTKTVSGNLTVYKTAFEPNHRDSRGTMYSK